MAKKPAIPTPGTSDNTLNMVLSTMKENIELMTGARPGTRQIAQLANTATTSEIITKINEVIAKLNYSGQ